LLKQVIERLPPRRYGNAVISFSAPLETLIWLDDQCATKGIHRSQVVCHYLRLGRAYEQQLQAQGVNGVEDAESSESEDAGSAEHG